MHNVSNFALQCELFINNSSVNYMETAKDDITCKQTSSMVLFATTKTGIGADM